MRMMNARGTYARAIGWGNPPDSTRATIRSMVAVRVETVTSTLSVLFFFSSRRRHTRCSRDWSSDVCSSDLLILLMYGAALRTSEALSLTRSDVDLSGAVLTIRNSKFFKSRLVPIGPNTVRVLAEYASRHDSPSRKPNDRFFVGRNSKQIPIHMFERAFKQIRRHADLHSEGGPRRQPRLHDLRHTSAVHRLTRWYREGKEIGRASCRERV